MHRLARLRFLQLLGKREDAARRRGDLNRSSRLSTLRYTSGPATRLGGRSESRRGCSGTERESMIASRSATSGLRWEHDLLGHTVAKPSTVVTTEGRNSAVLAGSTGGRYPGRYRSAEQRFDTLGVVGELAGVARVLSRTW